MHFRTFTFGTGRPIHNGLSSMVVLVIIIMFAILAIVFFAAAVMCCYKRFKDRRPVEVVSAYSRID
jgi:uncharacterized membrane protein YhaH (DUF805 family)